MASDYDEAPFVKVAYYSLIWDSTETDAVLKVADINRVFFINSTERILICHNYH